MQGIFQVRGVVRWGLHTARADANRTSVIGGLGIAPGLAAARTARYIWSGKAGTAHAAARRSESLQSENVIPTITNDTIQKNTTRSGLSKQS